MAIRNDHDDYGWALPPKSASGRENRRERHDYEELKPDLKDTMRELAMTLGGIVGVFLVLIALAKMFG